MKRTSLPKKAATLLTAAVMLSSMGAVAAGAESPEVYSAQTAAVISVGAKYTPDTVTGFRVKSYTENKIVLAWSKVSKASGYRIYRYNDSTKAWDIIKTISSGKTVTYTDSSLKSGTEQKYRIKAYRKVSGKTYWASLSAEVTGGTKCDTVRELTAVADSNTIQVYWSEVNCDGYQIYYRNATDNGSWKKAATVKGALSYTIKNVNKKKTYQVRIRAFYKSAYDKKNYFGSFGATVTPTKTNKGNGGADTVYNTGGSDDMTETIKNLPQQGDWVFGGYGDPFGLGYNYNYLFNPVTKQYSFAI